MCSGSADELVVRAIITPRTIENQQINKLIRLSCKDKMQIPHIIFFYISHFFARN